MFALSMSIIMTFLLREIFLFSVIPCMGLLVKLVLTNLEDSEML